MNEVYFRGGDVGEYDEVVIHESGWVECKDMNTDTRVVNSIQHFPEHGILKIHESDELGKSVKHGED